MLRRTTGRGVKEKGILLYKGVEEGFLNADMIIAVHAEEFGRDKRGFGAGVTSKLADGPCPTLLNMGDELGKGDLVRHERAAEGGAATGAIELVEEGVTQVQANQGFRHGAMLTGRGRDQEQTPCEVFVRLGAKTK